MKHLRFLLFSMVLGVIPASMAFSQGFEEVGNALKAGNATKLASFFDLNVELTILDAEGTYSKAQAEQVVKNFFATHSPTSFTKKHESTSGGSSQFAVGTLVTSNGTFRVDIFYKTVGGQLRVQRLKFTEG